MKKIKDRIIHLLGIQWVQHVLFWIVYFFPTCHFFLVACEPEEAIIPLFGFLSVTLVTAYFNLNYLMPRLLLKEKYIAYGLSLVLVFVGYCAVYTQWYLICLEYFYKIENHESYQQAYWDNMFDLGIMLVLTTAFKLSKDRFKQREINRQLVNENLSAEIRFLRGQFNSHFLFNTMNNLYALSLRKSDKTPVAILKLSEMIEYMLYDSDVDRVTVKREIEYLQSYIEVEQLRHPSDGEILLSENGDLGHLKIAPFLLVPFVENAFKHSGFGDDPDAYIRCQAFMRDNLFVFAVENSKSSYTGPANREHGMGLVNVQKRLNMLYPGRHELIITESETEYSVELIMDLTWD
ncbi:MAG: histidine kinase [Bacteroidia bacterium]|nr:histidine kinase [Bacteroidia bacterium]